MVVVRRGDTFLVVQEHGDVWSLPGGRVRAGETFVDTAARATADEAGLAVRLTRLLRLEHNPGDGAGARIRAFFLAEPAGEREPKAHPDAFSQKAAWKTLEEIRPLPLRSDAMLRVLEHVAAGGDGADLRVLAAEDAPFGA